MHLHWSWPVVVLASAGLVGHAEAQGVPTTGRIRVSGALHQQRGAYGYFEFQTPTLLVLWVLAQPSPKGIFSLQMRRRGAAFIQPGRYPVMPGAQGRVLPQDSSVFQVTVQHEARTWDMDSGSVTIERADTLSLSGRVSLRGSRLSDYEGRPPADTIRIEARFSLRYEPTPVLLRQHIHQRTEPHHLAPPPAVRRTRARP